MMLSTKWNVMLSSSSAMSHGIKQIKNVLGTINYYAAALYTH